MVELGCQAERLGSPCPQKSPNIHGTGAPLRIVPGTVTRDLRRQPMVDRPASESDEFGDDGRDWSDHGSR